MVSDIVTPPDMPIPLRSRLFINSLAVLLLGMGIAGVLTWRAVEGLYLRTQGENLLAQAELIAAALQGQPLPNTTAEPYLQSSNIQPGIHTRLLGQQGTVILGLPIAGDSQLRVPPIENAPAITPDELLERPEISQALQGKPATSIRRVASAEYRRVLYAAAPILDGAGQVSALVYLATPLPAAGLPTNLLLEMGAATLIAVALALVTGNLLARRIITPVEKISQSASAVSSGNLDQSVQANSGILELDQLGQAFNSMTHSLQQSNLAKNAFVADVTHELRTPLTVIKGTIETLEDGALDDISGRGALLVSMQRETERLIRLVNDLLVLTRLEAGALELDIQSLNLLELTHLRCVHLRPLADQRQVELRVFAKSSAPACILGDADRLSQVLDNLLDNALRYSPPGSCISVEIRPLGSQWECAVHDQGPGIPEKHLPYIFERFYRADTSRNRSTGGAGLGLAIARALIQAQGGQISAESVPGAGTTLRFSLPASQDCHQVD